MARVTLGKINDRAAKDLLNTSEMQEVLLEHAREIALKAGAGFTADVRTGPARARAMVKSTTFDAARRQATSNVLLKAIT